MLKSFPKMSEMGAALAAELEEQQQMELAVTREGGPTSKAGATPSSGSSRYAGDVDAVWAWQVCQYRHQRRLRQHNKCNVVGSSSKMSMSQQSSRPRQPSPHPRTLRSHLPLPLRLVPPPRQQRDTCMTRLIQEQMYEDGFD